MPVRPGRVALAASAAMVAGAGYSVGVEPRWFALRRVDVPVLPAGAWPIRLLHLSDLHLLARHRRKAAWVGALADLHPDLVVNTGDCLGDPSAVPAMLAALGGLLDLPGAFVLGNNDYFGPRPKSPHHYFLGSHPRQRGAAMPAAEIRAVQSGRGWEDLTDRSATLEIRGQRIALAGVDDPYLVRDRYDLMAGPADPAAAVRIGVLHSPEPRLLSRFAADGYELLLAGHTHGGQVRIPGLGALTTNSGLDRSRARGLSRWGARAHLHVSAGLGSNPYLPIRFCCRPEATLLTLVPVPEPTAGGPG